MRISDFGLRVATTGGRVKLFAMADLPVRDPRPPESPPLAARIGLVAGPLAALTVYFLLPGGDGGLAHSARACGGVFVLEPSRKLRLYPFEPRTCPF